MSPLQAANVIGCTPDHVRLLIRRGTLAASRKPLIVNDQITEGYVYELDPYQVESYAKKKFSRGRPRSRRDQTSASNAKGTGQKTVDRAGETLESAPHSSSSTRKKADGRSRPSRGSKGSRR